MKTKYPMNRHENELSKPIQAVVTNEKSNYFGEDFYVTHKAEAIDKTWYKAVVGYDVSELKDVDVWFSDSELELLDELSYA